MRAFRKSRIVIQESVEESVSCDFGIELSFVF